MRVQSIFSNNYTKNGMTKSTGKNPAFEANIYSVTTPMCHEGTICKPAIIALSRIFAENAVNSGKILVENMASVVVRTHEDRKIEFVLIDKSTALFKKLKNGLESINGTEEQNKFIVAIKNDSETVKMPLLATEDEICPSRQFRNFLNEILDGPTDLN